MKKVVLFSIAIAATGTAFAQNGNVGIGTTTPNADAKLDITATNKGLLLPRIALTGTASAAPLSAHVAGMTVYNTKDTLDVTKGTYFNNGTKWVRVGDALNSAWYDIKTNTPASDTSQDIFHKGHIATGDYRYNIDSSSYKHIGLLVTDKDTSTYSTLAVVSNHRSSASVASFSKMYYGAVTEDPYITFNKQIAANDTLRRYAYIKGGNEFQGLLIQTTKGTATTDYNQRKIDSSNILLNAYGGRVGIGVFNPSAIFHIRYKQDASDSLNHGFANDIVFDNYEPSSNDGLSLVFRRFRGSIAAPTNIKTNDRIGGFNFMGQVSNTVQNLGLIGTIYKGDSATLKSSMYFAVNSGSVVNDIALYIDSSKYVGIGTNAPKALLHVRGKVRDMVRFENDSAWSGVYAITHSSNPVFFPAFLGAKNKGTAEAPVYTDSATVVGWVGGRDYKSQKDATDNATISPGGSAVIFKNDENITDNSKASRIEFETTLKGTTYPGTRMVLNNAGSLGIGVINIADTIKLHVAGNIKADGKVYANQFVAGTSTFPDYVFESYYNGNSEMNPSYKFASLDETESFIKENGHLPGFTPAKEVIKSGSFDMTKTAITSVEKIEELYLHMINLEKRVKELEKENAALKNK